MAVVIDTGTQLALERTRLAHERTLMAWVRTAVSLISFGFTIYKFFEFEAGNGGPVLTDHVLSPREFGMLMIGTGLAALALSTVEHIRYIRQQRAQYGTAPRSVTAVVAIIVSGVGVFALIAALFRG